MRCLRHLPLGLVIACTGAKPGTGADDTDPIPTSGTGIGQTSAYEICDGIDNDGDGLVDEGLLSTWYRDADGDNYGDAADSVEACEAPEGYIANSSDCDDTHDRKWETTSSDACDNVDNDCDGELDEDHRVDWWLGTINDGVLYEVSTLDASFTASVALSGPGAAETINSTDSWDFNLVVVHNLGLGAGTLQEFDSCTGELTTIGSTGTGSLPGIGFGPDGALYAVEADSDQVIRIETSDASWTVVVDLGFSLGNSGAAYDCSQERLWIADQTNSQIFWVDPMTGLLGGFQTTDVPLQSVGLEWDPQTRTLLAATGSALYRIDTTTGNGTYIGDFPTPTSVGTLALFPPCP